MNRKSMSDSGTFDLFHRKSLFVNNLLQIKEIQWILWSDILESLGDIYRKYYKWFMQGMVTWSKAVTVFNCDLHFLRKENSSWALWIWFTIIQKIKSLYMYLLTITPQITFNALVIQLMCYIWSSFNLVITIYCRSMLWLTRQLGKDMKAQIFMKMSSFNLWELKIFMWWDKACRKWLSVSWIMW